MTVTTTAAYTIMLAAFVYLLYDRGGPYFAPPVTIVDHLAPWKHNAHDALLVIPEVRPLIPPGARVACFRPENGKYTYDTGSFHTAVAMLPHQVVVPPYAAAEGLPKETLPDYVIAVDQPFTDSDYKLDAEFPGGRLYKVVR